MKKIINILLLIIISFSFAAVKVCATRYLTPDEIPRSSYVVGTHLLTSPDNEILNTSGNHDAIFDESGVIYTHTIMFISRSITENEYSDMIFYYKNRRSNWEEATDGTPITDLPDTFTITHVNGICIDDPCPETGGSGGGNTGDGFSITFKNKNGALTTPVTTNSSGYLNVNDIPDMVADPGYVFDGWEDENGNPVNVKAPFEADMILQPIFTPITYIIHFNLNGGSGNAPADKTCTIDSEANCMTPSTEPTRTGYTFLGWGLERNNSTGSNDEVKPLIQVEEAIGDILIPSLDANNEVTLYAVWEPVRYSVLYDLDGGEFNSADLSENTHFVSMDSPNIAVGNPVKDGYSFGSWSLTNATSVGANAFKMQAPGNVKLKANWNPNPLTVTFNPNGGTGGTGGVSSQCNYDGCTITRTNPTKGSYTFKYWLYEEGGYIYHKDDVISGLSGSITLKAVYNDEDTHSINYDIDASEGEEIDNNVISEYVTGVGTNLPIPRKTGFDFDGWIILDNNNQPTAGEHIYKIEANKNVDYSLKPAWKVKTYKISYISLIMKNNEVRTNITSEEKDFGSSVTLPTTLRSIPYHTFEGWVNGFNGTELYNGGQNIIVNGDMVFVGKWKATIKYSIGYDLDGGSFASNSSHPYNYVLGSGGISITNPVRDGYHFDGWTIIAPNNASFTGNILNVPAGGGDVELKAVWSRNRFDVTYNLAGGSIIDGSSFPLTVQGGTNFTLPQNASGQENVLARDGYSFGGWTDDNNNGQPVSVINNVGANISVTATWNPKNFEYHYYKESSGDEMIPGSQYNNSLSFATSIDIKPYPPSELDFDEIFIGWIYNGVLYNAGDQFVLNSYTDKVFFRPYIVHAISNDKIHSIQYNGNGLGTDVINTLVDRYIEGDTFELAIVSRDGYRFDGWYTDQQFNNPITSVTGKNTDLVLYAKWTPIPSVGRYLDVVGDNSIVRVTFDNIGNTETHYPITIIANYADGTTSTPQTFIANATISAEFDYKPGMKIRVSCNSSNHYDVEIDERDFDTLHKVTLNYLKNSNYSSVITYVKEGQVIPSNTVIYDNYTFNNYNWFTDSARTNPYDNVGVLSNIEIYGIRRH